MVSIVKQEGVVKSRRRERSGRAARWNWNGAEDVLERGVDV